MGSGSNLNNLAVKMPGRMPEDRQHDRKAEQEDDRTAHQQAGNDQSPHRHSYRVGENHADRGQYRRGGADVVINQQRKRDGADG